MANLGTEKIYSMYIYSRNTALVHIGNKLLKWIGFPSEVTLLETLHENMNEREAVIFYFNEYVYILDGINYLQYDGESVIDLRDIAYIPTTTVSRAPSGGGDPLEDVNLLQPKRRNEFVGDGTSTEYFLDATNIDLVDSVKVNDEPVTDYEVNLILGKITFKTAPAKPRNCRSFKCCYRV